MCSGYVIELFLCFIYSLYLKEEASDFLEQNSIKDLVVKYSQFINFNIYLWDTTTIQEEEPIEEDDEDTPPEMPNMEDDDEDEDAAVREWDGEEIVGHYSCTAHRSMK